MGEEPKSQTWWQTIPGILTATAAIITAVTGLLIALYQVGVFDGRGRVEPKPPITSANPPDKPTPVPPPQETTDVLRSDVDEIAGYTWISDGPGLAVFDVDYRYDPRHKQPMYMQITVYSEAGPTAPGKRPPWKRIAQGLTTVPTAQGRVRVDARKQLGQPAESEFVEVVLLEERVPVKVGQFPFRRLWGP
jgi:hypothetical protein